MKAVIERVMRVRLARHVVDLGIVVVCAVLTTGIILVTSVVVASTWMVLSKLAVQLGQRLG